MQVLSGFLNSLLSFILKFFFWIVGLIASIVVYPIQALLVTAFPSLGDFLTTILNYFTNSVFPMISFIRETFLSITCLPRPLFTIIVGIFVFRYTLIPALRGIVALINVYYMTKGGNPWYKVK